MLELWCMLLEDVVFVVKADMMRGLPAIWVRPNNQAGLRTTVCGNEGVRLNNQSSPLATPGLSLMGSLVDRQARDPGVDFTFDIRIACVVQVAIALLERQLHKALGKLVDGRHEIGFAQGVG